MIRQWIKDVIYGLKTEYGEPLYIKRDSAALNLSTGAKTITTVQKRIPLAIPLPINLRLSFLKSLGIAKVGGLEAGESEVLVERSDIADETLIKNASYIEDSRNRKRRIVRYNDYEEAIIFIVRDEP